MNTGIKRRVLALLLSLAMIVTMTPTVTMTAFADQNVSGGEIDNAGGYEEMPHTHEYNQEVTEDKYLKTAATCTSKAVYYKSCECGASSKETASEATFKSGNALEHAWDEGKITTNPTCTEKGVKTFRCTREGCDGTKTEDVVALGHQLVKVDAKAPSKSESGNTEYYICARCNKYFSDSTGKNEITKKVWLINPTGETESAIANIVYSIESLGDNPSEEQKQQALTELRKINTQALADAMGSEDSTEVISNLKAIEEKIGSADVVNSGAKITGVSIVGGGLNASTNGEALKTVNLVVAVADNESSIRGAAGNDVDLSNAVVISMNLENVATNENGKLSVPVAITFDVPAEIDATKMIVLHNSDTFGLETLTPILSNNNTKATIIVDHFSDFMIAEQLDGSGDGGGSDDGGGSGKKDNSGLIIAAAVGAAIVAGVAAIAVLVSGIFKNNPSDKPADNPTDEPAVDPVVDPTELIYSLAVRSNPSTGYYWEMTNETKDAELVDSTFTSDNPELVGAPGINCFKFKISNAETCYFRIVEMNARTQLPTGRYVDSTMLTGKDEPIEPASFVSSIKLTQNKLTANKNGKIKVSFAEPEIDGVISYQIYRATDKSFKKNVKKYTTKKTSYDNAKDLKKGTKYYYKVRAKVKMADGTTVYTAWSNVKSATCKKSI